MKTTTNSAAASLLTKKPGSVASMCSNASNSGVYASSADGRFVVWVRRRMVGDKGRRSYHYTFEAVDRAVPSNGQSFTAVPQLLTERSNPAKVFEAVARYAAAL
jgi:hypothetical protein